jgi:hypothetical protein
MSIKMLKNLQDAVQYWHECLSRPDDDQDIQVAYDMVRVVSSDHFHDWYDGPDSDHLFAELYDNVSELEVPGGPDYYRQAK